MTKADYQRAVDSWLKYATPTFDGENPQQRRIQAEYEQRVAEEQATVALAYRQFEKFTRQRQRRAARAR